MCVIYKETEDLTESNRFPSFLGHAPSFRKRTIPSPPGIISEISTARRICRYALCQCPNPSGAGRCFPEQSAVSLLSTPWKLYLLALIGAQTLRFGQIRQALPDVSRASVTKYLTELERDGFLYRTVYPAPPLRTDYSLSPLGLGVLPLVRKLIAWSDDPTQ